MLIRFSKKSKPVEITTDEFDELVKKGKLTPRSLVKNKFIAKGKWVSIANMERFHRKSSIEYPPGSYLKQSRKIEDRRWKQKAESSKLEENYRSGMMIEQYLELVPVKNLCVDFEVPAASRLTFMPAFYPESVITLLFGLGAISISVVSGTTQIWGSWRKTGRMFDITKAINASIKLSYSKIVYPFNDLPLFLKQAKDAIDCYTLAIDGFGYRHEVFSDSTDIDVRWSNPTDKKHPVQRHLISSYFNIVSEAVLNMGDRINKVDTKRLLPGAIRAKVVPSPTNRN